MIKVTWEKFKSLLKSTWVWLTSFFETHKHLYVTHNQYNHEGEIIDVLEKKFEVRKFYKCGPKHMLFKTMDGTVVELKTSTPMDYMTETVKSKL